MQPGLPAAMGSSGSSHMDYQTLASNVASTGPQTLSSMQSSSGRSTDSTMGNQVPSGYSTYKEFVAGPSMGYSQWIAKNSSFGNAPALSAGASKRSGMNPSLDQPSVPSIPYREASPSASALTKYPTAASKRLSKKRSRQFTDSQPLALSSFKAFRRLPLNLRSMIWKLGLPKHGRVIDTAYHSTGHRSQHLKTPLLWVNRESRAVVIGNEEKRPVSSILRLAHFDFQKDILYLSPLLTSTEEFKYRFINDEYIGRLPTSTLAPVMYLLSTWDGKSDLASIQHLAIDLRLWNSSAAWLAFMRGLPVFTGLKTITFVNSFGSLGDNDLVMQQEPSRITFEWLEKYNAARVAYLGVHQTLHMYMAANTRFDLGFLEQIRLRMVTMGKVSSTV